MSWDNFKDAFYAWEKPTAQFLETWLKSPLVLEPAGSMLTAMMRAKAASDRMSSMWWGAMGIATKRDQERTLHTLNELESKLLDLEEKLEAAEQKKRS
jgi:hypothetical protein